ncbi:methionyl-tRNA formyltransferase [Corynebacterium efficiens YS-314]|uniref:Methionyl-tRNA formyltransferase n=1 Tax=Corynebacterium efficiens (strain DSM 44549 / YS-314 / AJ 12310 / JCM 11189 / NBRC 100395) TaxID=196164 RepID=FMT_COREF|nr:methionyl-tRNA formyltransferase [Corynebacterium efficiens]Q8FT52.1 RecName: Full=Methionyl-tRNA formyltransferase [Corynebacterium efficiens YS-314]EEW49598.1 methionyl-tRNA formyltransferase [Corynebacterium efficiens YS-314]BAC18529.1 putative methionyl-tRNA formyltransferase [Corynebacterium efficiens YS-314]
MRLVFAGTPEPAVVALQKLIDSEHEVVAVLTQPDARRGRGRTLHPSAVAELAQAHGIEVIKPTSLKADTGDGRLVRQRLAELQPDCLPVVAFGQLITRDLLDVAPHGWVNLHFSLLPAWRGAAPVQAAIRAGDQLTGATCFRIDEGLDTGVILSTLEETIQPTDTADDLLTRLAYAGADLLVDTMTGLEAGTISPREQTGEATYAPKITTVDARIDWTVPAEVIDRHIRAHTPGPGAWTMLDDARLKVGPLVTVTDLPDVPTLNPGALHATRDAVYVGTGSTPVALGQIQPPGKKMMNAADWARGVHLDQEASFE